MTAMVRELQLSELCISRLLAVAEAVGEKLGGKRQDLTPHSPGRGTLAHAVLGWGFHRNVRANLETTVWRQARATENAYLHCGAGLVACRWLSG